MNGNRGMNASFKKINKPLYYQIIGLSAEWHGVISMAPTWMSSLLQRETTTWRAGKLFCSPVGIKNLQASPPNKRLQHNQQIREPARAKDLLIDLIEATLSSNSLSVFAGLGKYSFYSRKDRNSSYAMESPSKSLQGLLSDVRHFTCFDF